MTRHPLRVLFFVAVMALLLSGFLSYAATLSQPSAPKPKKRDASRVYLVHADELRYDRWKNNDAQVLTGHVQFEHAGARLFCDSANFFEASNSFEAFGHVRMLQGDTLSLHSDYGYYDGNDQLMQALHNVVLKNRKTTLYTDSLFYDRLWNMGYFEEGGKLVVSGIALEEDEAKEGLLMGIVRYTSIGGGVWIDRGDTVDPLAGAEVRLLDESGTVLQTATTGGDGEYLFSNLMPGTYLLDASMPEGCVIIEPDDRRLNETQMSVITHATNRNGTSDPIELLMGEDQRKMNIGCVLPGRIGDFCWLDLDKDGLQGMDEPGIPNVRIELLRDGEYIAETETDQYGFWRFEDLYPAVYTLRVTAPDEVVATKQRTDIRIIASVLEEDGSGIYESAEVQVESDKANYNADIGFVCKKDGVVPDGTGEGKKQVWTGYKEGD